MCVCVEVFADSTAKIDRSAVHGVGRGYVQRRGPRGGNDDGRKEKNDPLKPVPQKSNTVNYSYADVYVQRSETGYRK